MGTFSHFVIFQKKKSSVWKLELFVSLVHHFPEEFSSTRKFCAGIEGDQNKNIVKFAAEKLMVKTAKTLIAAGVPAVATDTPSCEVVFPKFSVVLMCHFVVRISVSEIFSMVKKTKALTVCFGNFRGGNALSLNF